MKNNYQNENQIKSRERVRDNGEVFTNLREVNDMLDLVADYSYQLDITFMEPACGHGNFLVEILRRKLSIIIAKKYKKIKDREFDIMRAFVSIYGIDICAENVMQARERMFDNFKLMFKRKKFNANFYASIR